MTATYDLGDAVVRFVKDRPSQEEAAEINRVVYDGPPKNDAPATPITTDAVCAAMSELVTASFDVVQGVLK